MQSLTGRVLIAIVAILISEIAAEAEDIRIGAWNIEWLGFPDKRSKPGKDLPQDASDLAKYISDAGVDVLALEEIGVDRNQAPWRSSELDAVIEKLKSQYAQPWEYVLFPKTTYPEGTEDFVTRGQHIGIAWRTDKASLVGEPFAIPIDTNDTYGIKYWERRANALKLSFGADKTDVVFIPMHLKSNRNDVDPSDKDFTKKQRTAETREFVDKVQMVKKHFTDEDIVFLGDSNFLAPEDESTKLLAEAGFVDLNADDRGTTAAWGEGYSSAPFDRIFVPAGQIEFAACKQKVHTTSSGTDEDIKNHRRRLSDHYLISTVIAIGQDDD